MIANSDVFVFYDNVQFERRGWQNRNYIKDKNGEKKLLSIPVATKGNFHTPIHNIKIFYDKKTRSSVEGILYQNYRDSPFFSQAFSILQNSLDRCPVFLSDLTIDLTIAYAAYLGIEHTRFIRASEIDIAMDQGPTGNLVAICNYFKATHYINGPAGKAYMETEKFMDADIQFVWHDYSHPVYTQGSHPFLSYLSIFDLICNQGKDSLSILYQSQIQYG